MKSGAWENDGKAKKNPVSKFVEDLIKIYWHWIL